MHRGPITLELMATFAPSAWRPLFFAAVALLLTTGVAWAAWPVPVLPAAPPVLVAAAKPAPAPKLAEKTPARKAGAKAKPKSRPAHAR